MKKIDFSKVEFFTDLSHKTCVVRDVRKDLANAMYNNGVGLKYHALAIKIYNAKGEVELDDDECALIETFVENYGTPMLIEALKMKNEESVY